MSDDIEEIIKGKRFQELLEKVPEDQRAEVEAAIRKMALEFNDKVLKPLEVLIKK